MVHLQCNISSDGGVLLSCILVYAFVRIIDSNDDVIYIVVVLQRGPAPVSRLLLADKAPSSLESINLKLQLLTDLETTVNQQVQVISMVMTTVLLNSSQLRVVVRHSNLPAVIYLGMALYPITLLVA
jgi:ABC-type antimicrobial peptide transport system ATPase subunit